MAAVNKVILLGNLGADVELRHLPDGRPVGNVNIATTETWKDQDGNRNQHTEWHRLNFFGRQAEIASQYMRKGSPVFVEGQLRTRKWKDRDGNERQTTEIRVLNFQLLGSRQDRERSDQPSSDTSSPSTPGGSGTAGGGGMDDFEEDIPW